MAALDPEKIALDALWSLINGRTGITSKVLPRNLVKTADKKYLNTLATRIAPNDYPVLFVFSAGEATDPPVETFASGNGTIDYGVPMRINFEISLAFDKEDDANVTPLESEVRAVLLLLESTLRNAGHRWAGAVTERKTRALKVFSLSNSKVIRPVSTWVVSMRARPLRSLLIA